MKNPQTTIAPTFLMHIISAIDGVCCHFLVSEIYAGSPVKSRFLDQKQ